ncbi:MAG: glycosyltransferase [Lachnospiraceae bacterium]|nr:glycosyltransferase [Lachnospiraceae bacterium]
MINDSINVLQINAENFGAGGVSVIIWRLMEQLKNSNVHMSFVSQRTNIDERYLKAVEAQGGKVVYIRSSSNIIFRYFDRYRKCFAVLKNGDFDIIHINGNESFGIISYVLAAKKKHNCKIVVHAHSTRFMKEEHIWIKRIFKFVCQPLLIKNADCLLACSTEAAKFMYGSKAYKATIVKNGLDPQKYSYDKTMRKIIRDEYEADRKIIIGHIGRFVYAKNHEFIINVFEHVKKIHPDSELWLIGEKDGNGYEAVYSQVKDMGLLDSVKFVGNTEQIKEYLSAMDVLLFPSRFEGLPLVLVEAQVNGLSVVCSDAITDEAIFSDGVKKLSLNEPLKVWAENVISSGKKERQDIPYQKIMIGRFDISHIARTVLEEYRKLLK